MDAFPPITTNDGVVVHKEEEAYASMVDPFLVEALQNPRHRLTILRMELDIQMFLQNPDQHQFEFQHFPTSYLRLAAHRVAQHYHLPTVVQDNVLDGLGTKIVVKKLTECRYPAVWLSEIPAKQLEDDKHEQVKIVMRPKPSSTSSNEADELGIKHSFVRTVEERKEEYDRARVRIFSSPSRSESEDTMSQAPLDGKNLCMSRDEGEDWKNSMTDLERTLSIRDGVMPSPVAIFKDREKDRTDPDYDRSYKRYVKTMPTNQSFGPAPFSMQKFHGPFVRYDTVVPQFGQQPRSQPSLSYSTPMMNPLCTNGLSQTYRDAGHMRWPTSAMMYAQSYDQLRHAFFQAPYCQQPLSFDYTQNY